MPNVVGLELAAAQLALQNAGVLVLASIGYFGTWPITIDWIRSNTPPSTVTAQNPASGASVAANAPVTLTVSDYPVSVAYP